VLTRVIVVGCGDLYGELRADYLAKATGKALTLILDHRQVISFGAEFRTHLEYFSRTELDAIATSLAPIIVYVYAPPSGGFVCIVEGFSP